MHWTGVTGEIDALLALWTALERGDGALSFAAERGPLAPRTPLARVVREGTGARWKPGAPCGRQQQVRGRTHRR
ncbi:MAG: hypothetical protein U0531_11390 [Dehalococcoidia bacterium]